MLTDKQRWYAEIALDVVATILLGWFVVGALAGALVAPRGEDPGEFEKALPLLVQVAVTYGMWKLFRSFNWLQGTPPK